MSLKNNKTKLSSFSLTQEVVLNAPRAKVWTTLTANIDQWWAYRMAPEKTRSKITFEARVGGRFVEQWGRGEGALWGTVLFIRKPDIIRLNGVLGMSSLPVNSLYTYELIPRGKGTLVRVTHHCHGELLPKWGKSHDGGWRGLLQHYLKSLVERGERWPTVKARLNKD